LLGGALKLRGVGRRQPPEAERPSYKIRVIGASHGSLRDLYHAVLRWRWSTTLAAIALAFLTVNALFALGYLWCDGVAHMAVGSFRDAFYFSVQTMGTIGYGAMYPQSDAANRLVVAEALASLLLTALTAGLVFAKFSRSTARLVFSREAVVGPMNGVPTLSFRVGNARGNQIVNAELRVVLVRTEVTTEGKTFYRMLDLVLTRDRALSLSRSWVVLHIIDDASPLRGETEASLRDKEVELQVMVVGMDDAFMQTVHAAHRYEARQVLFDHRHVDVLSETANGDLVLDLHRFHDVEPIPPAGT